MARTNRGRKKNKRADQAQGGFVPASQHDSKRLGAQSNGSFAFNPAAVGPQESFSKYSRNTADYSDRKHAPSRGKKAAITLLVIILIAAVAGLGFYVFKEMQKNAINNDLHNLDKDQLEALDNELSGMTTFDEPFTMLLLGSDARSDDPGMGARTDTIVLCRIDPIENVISMLSIPRDTMIEIEGEGTQKFNAAYTFGGPSGTIAAVKELCGVDIDHYAEVNFEGLVGLVDAIGGIDVVVDETVDDPDAGDVIIPAGEQHLNGIEALAFSRSRAYANGDYTRVSNQRKVIDAIIHRGLSAPASDLLGLVRSATGFLTTDSAMDLDFIYSLADQMRHNNDKPLTIYSATLPSGTSMINGISYVIADQAGVIEIIKIFLAGGDISQALESSSIDSDVSNAGGSSIVNTPTPNYSYNYDYNYDYTYQQPTYTDPGYGYTPEPTPTYPDYGGDLGGGDLGGGDYGGGTDLGGGL